MQDNVLRVRDQLEDLVEVDPAEWLDAVMPIGKNWAFPVELARDGLNMVRSALKRLCWA